MNRIKVFTMFRQQPIRSVEELRFDADRSLTRLAYKDSDRVGSVSRLSLRSSISTSITSLSIRLLAFTHSATLHCS